MKTHLTIATCALAWGTILAVPARGQGLSATDAREAARFDAIVRAVTRAGYASPMIVGHGDSATDALFALLATHEGSGVLIALEEPAGAAPAQPVELERERTPADLGIRGIQFTAFLGVPGLYDVAVTHEPFMLEMSRRFETHHVLRRQGTRLEAACEFPGGASSSASKGIGSITSSRRVAVTRDPGGSTLRFQVTTIDETTERSSGQSAPVTTAHSEATKHFDLPATGSCRER